MTANTATDDHEQTTVLIIEDEENLADLYALWLTTDYDVRTTYSGERGLEQASEEIDTVILDRRMPGISGDEVLHAIREGDYDCCVVIVSAVTPDFDVLGMRFDDYLVKPVDRDELHAAVERMRAKATYDDTVQEYLRLATTEAKLQAEKTVQELQTNDEYADLQRRIAGLRPDADGVAAIAAEGFNVGVENSNTGSTATGVGEEED